MPFFQKLAFGLASGVSVSVLYESLIFESGAGLDPKTFAPAVDKEYVGPLALALIGTEKLAQLGWKCSGSSGGVEKHGESPCIYSCGSVVGDT